eukprot:TRINITY_DN5234_c0_g3_i1.p1 TRINITY_DN5234_c0_g3~~TRINITY_DN5234_c0_g3_i1.p1  ORF type:complete len:170 (-),score=27.52 TRINITY_DN5234_c0_g3_i1:352-861(-)
MIQERKETTESEGAAQSMTQERAKDMSAYKRVYTRIPREIRRRLLEGLALGEMTIKAAAKELGINYSSAKNIVKIFRQQNRVDAIIGKNTTRPVAAEVAKKEGKLKRFTAKRTRLTIDALQLPTSGTISNVNAKERLLAEGTENFKPCFNFSIYSSLIFSRYSYSLKAE